MEITFRNKAEDLERYYNYVFKETDEGKKLGKQAVQNWLKWQILGSAFLGFLFTEEWWAAIAVAIFIFLVFGFIGLLISRFDPIHYSGMQLYRNQAKSMTSRDLQFLQLPRTITLDNDWLELRSSVVLHRWRWNSVDKVALTSDFISIHIGTWIFFVPKRDFSSEQSFKEFGNSLIQRKESHANEPLPSS